MLHLPAERLAALVDDDGCTAAEAEHLRGCVSCARERDAYRAMQALAAHQGSARLEDPLVSWETLAVGLRAEGLISDERSISRSGEHLSATVMPLYPAARAIATGPVLEVPRRSTASLWRMRVAAGLLIAAAGAAYGRWSAGAPVVPVVAGIAHNDTMLTVGSTSVSPTDDGVSFASREDALTQLARYERLYQRAASYLVEHDSSGSTGSVTDSTPVYRARLAALDNVMAATREALYEAPHDPIINKYYMATLGAREATLRQLNVALPVGNRINQY